MSGAAPAAAAALGGARRDRYLIFAAGFLRSVVVGMTGVLLAVYLHALGWGIERTGLVVSVGLAGAATATLLVSFTADRAGRRRTVFLMGLLTAAGGAALIPAALLPQPTPLFLLAAFFGMINGLGRDRGPAYALEQAMLPGTTTDEGRTLILAWYSLLLDAGLAIGSLLGGLPYLLRVAWGWEAIPSYQAAWGLAVALSAIPPALCAALSPHVEVRAPETRGAGKWLASLPRESRRRIAALAALTGLDSLGGGFITGALVSFWFFRRFGIGEEWLGPLFFAARVANAASHLVAAWLARRIGLLNTMVFTHIPSSLFLLAVPFAPGLGWAAALFLAREALVEMDVPTRQSYILAVVRPEERAFASGMTTFTRNVAYAAAPVAAGYAMTGLALASPLFFCGGIKIAYDLLLYFSFRRVRPPEESRPS